MDKHFDILFLNEAFEFLSSLERKHYEKILYNIRKSQVEIDPELFKKLSDDIWEFRTLYQRLQYRLLAFGIRLQQRIPWLFLHMDLSKKEVKFQTMKFKKRLTFGQFILRTNN